MPIWLPYLPTIISAVIELIRLLKELSKDEIKETKAAFKAIRTDQNYDCIKDVLNKLEHKKCD
jgi:hypothetical protein